MTTDLFWHRPHPAEAPALPQDEVHVWRASLDRAPSQLHRLMRTLSADERARAERFHFEKDRLHFIAARGLLRTLLGRYLNQAPGALHFRYNAYGKPALADQPARDRLCFNLSHSGGLVLYALTRDREVGIDLEFARPLTNPEEIAHRFFSDQENATLRALPASRRREAFFTCWTRKEAYIKAHGEGLSLPLDAFDVSLAPGEPAALLHTRDDPGEAARWSLHALAPGPGYFAALAVEGRGWRLACWQWPEE